MKPAWEFVIRRESFGAENCDRTQRNSSNKKPDITDKRAGSWITEFV